MTVRAKFSVGSVKKWMDANGGCQSEEVMLYAVYGAAPDSENAKFWTATPTGNLTMTINNPEAWGTFRPGQEFYVDFTPAPKPEVAPPTP